ncbi:MAG: hypothetical protein FJX77_13840, partial [Armatimonadetes bacterium]|nr:hypothetical protein [Armatimonadota bacterium]
MKRHGWTVRVGALGLAVWAASAGVADPPGCRLYTTTADFDTGRYQGTNATAVADQVQLNTGATTYENAWIADSGDGLVIKIDTNTGRAVAGYLTGAPLRSASGSNFDNDAGNCGFGGNLGPSRTSVDRDGNCWVGNRAFGKQPTLTQILAEGGEDRNGNGVIDTSRDIDGDGVIEISVPGEVLPWGQDERVARHYRVGVNNGVARAVAVGPNGNVYVGMFNERRIYEVASNVTAPPPAGAAPTPLNTWTLPGGTGNGPYGFAFGPNGRLYVGTISTVSYELDPGTGAFRTFSHPSATSYGIAVDANGIVFLAGLTSPARLIRLNP